MSQSRSIALFLLRSVTAGLALAFIVLFLWPAMQSRTDPAQTDAPESSRFQASFADAVDRAAPSVVSIYTQRVEVQQIDPQLQRILRRQYIARARQDMGSGVVVSSDGYILTNNHVVTEVRDIRVALWDGRVAQARVVGSDPQTDLAVLKVELDGLPAAPLAENPQLRVGDVVLAIGNALGLSHTVTMGIVSATGRNDIRSARYEDFIQTDAAINAGNSGGALVNASGKVIGINTRQLAGAVGGQNIGFAIPIEVARNVMGQILEYGEVRRAWIGATFKEASLNLTGEQVPRGVEVSQVAPSGPAWFAGIRAGDRLLTLDGQAIEDARSLLLEIDSREPGSQVELEVLRDGQTFQTYATLIQQPPLR
ncbi:MAG: trypsin-like peptidase domain-containing protein [Xanthomonadales bacterium]|nr:trypsin-like peptidase domain-containing protein [Xanthomonadales bacterium]